VQKSAQEYEKKELEVWQESGKFPSWKSGPPGGVSEVWQTQGLKTAVLEVWQ